MSESDPLIKVVMDDPVFAMPERVAFDHTLSYEARLVACLWFARRRKPSADEIEEALWFSGHNARLYLDELESSASMRGFA